MVTLDSMAWGGEKKIDECQGVEESPWKELI
jgi:hypothetical protein